MGNTACQKNTCEYKFIFIVYITTLLYLCPVYFVYLGELASYAKDKGIFLKQFHSFTHEILYLLGSMPNAEKSKVHAKYSWAKPNAIYSDI